MRIAVPREIDPANRVAATRKRSRRFKGLGAEVAVEPAPERSPAFPTPTSSAAGATVGRQRRQGCRRGAQGAPSAASELARYKKGALVIAIMDPLRQGAPRSRQMADAGIIAFAMGVDAAHHPRADHGRPLRARPISRATGR